MKPLTVECLANPKPLVKTYANSLYNRSRTMICIMLLQDSLHDRVLPSFRCHDFFFLMNLEGSILLDLSAEVTAYYKILKCFFLCPPDYML